MYTAELRAPRHIRLSAVFINHQHVWNGTKKKKDVEVITVKKTPQKRDDKNANKAAGGTWQRKTKDGRRVTVFFMFC